MFLLTTIGLAAKEILDLISNIVKKASELLHIDFPLLLSYWKNVFQLHYKCILQNLSLNRQRQKKNPQKRQDINESALLETYHVRAAQ